MTGYARKYAIGLLNQEAPGLPPLRHPRQSRYGSEVQQALCVAWQATRYICAKRLMPFLPDFLPYLERKGRIQLNAEQRKQLLSMRSATAERFLRTQQKPTPRGLSTTQVGTWLKHQIPIRTFAGWEDAQPGFLEMDLVAHCGGHTQGSYLYTLTLTDVATGWTECLPLLARTADLVVAALNRARTLFPFPILGIDIDNGAEFINADVMAYCEREHLTFTRGRPEVKNDQCRIEQKNRAVVRAFAGHDRLVGDHAYQQLGELYRALRLYVNCFQPCMKLLSRSQEEGGRVHRVYDPAKTPLQRLLLSGVLSASAQQELEKGAQALDPLDLGEQVEQLQLAVFGCAVLAVPSASPLRFAVEQCLSEPQLAPRAEPDPRALVCEDPNGQTPFLNWQRSLTNPFASEWERILTWVRTHPEQSTRDLLEELQRLFPGCYQPSQYPALQRVVRKMRAYLRSQTADQPWPLEMIHGPLDTAASSVPIVPEAMQPGTSLPVPSTLSVRELGTEAAEAPCLPRPVLRAPEEMPSQEISADACGPFVHNPGSEQNPAPLVSVPCEKQRPLTSFPPVTIEQAIQAFLEAQVATSRTEKTREWHRTSLHSLQQYLSQQHLCSPRDLTTTAIRGWIAFLRGEVSATGSHRVANTIHSYARSARAFCTWSVRQGYLTRTPFVKGTIPKAKSLPVQVVSPDVFERLLGACVLPGALMDHATARNQALLWLFLETGVSVAEVCALRVRDVDREQGHVSIQGTGAHARQVRLGENGLRHLLLYLEAYRLKVPGGTAGEDVLFCSEAHQPLTPNAITQLFRRLRERAGITEQQISPTMLRDTFAVRYLHTGGSPSQLRKVLGLGARTPITRYQKRSEQA
jgi:site-specific recombinase XerD